MGWYYVIWKVPYFHCSIRLPASIKYTFVWGQKEVVATLFLHQICKKTKPREEMKSKMALQMIKVIICSHEAVSSSEAKCLLFGLGVKTRFPIWFPTEKMKKDKWSSSRWPAAAWEPSHEDVQSLYSHYDPSVLILFRLWLYNFLRQTVCHQTQRSICNQ